MCDLRSLPCSSIKIKPIALRLLRKILARPVQPSLVSIRRRSTTISIPLNHNSRHPVFLCRNSTACMSASRSQRLNLAPIGCAPTRFPIGSLESTAVHRSSVQPSCSDSSHDVKCVPAEKCIFFKQKKRNPWLNRDRSGTSRRSIRPYHRRDFASNADDAASSLTLVIRGAPPVRTHARDVCDDPARPG